MSRFILFLMMVAQAFSEQPEAEKPVTVPSRPLQWGKLNFLQTTDVHGWYSGHLQEPQYSADWGDYISFSRHMHDKADSLGVDLLVVDTGDRIEGNGLYDGSQPKGKFSYDIYVEQEIDVLNAGNHELYQAYAVDKEYSFMRTKYEGKYLASNLDYIDPQTGLQVPAGPRFRNFTTKNQKLRIMAFGFMYDFTGNANNSVVQPVKEAIKEPWFQDAIRQDVDLFLVNGHAPLRSPEYKTIFEAIRSQKSDTPIQFFGAHTHVRDFVKYDNRSCGFQAGRYMETIGWMSIDWQKDDKNPRALNNITFQRRYIDNNLSGYQFHSELNATAFPTEHGKNVSATIFEARKKLELDHVYGCAPRDLYLKGEYPGNNSLLTWLEQEVLPDVTINPERMDIPRVIIVNSPFMRFDIKKGYYTRDTTYNVTPFTNKMRYIKDVLFSSAKNVVDLVNNGGSEFEVVKKRSLELNPSPAPALVSGRDTSDLTVGYVTNDDGGSDGDDTIHSPVPNYPFPNCVHKIVGSPDSESQLVDLVFPDFLESHINRALKHIGQNHAPSEPLRNETLSDSITGWIQKNWPC